MFFAFIGQFLSVRRTQTSGRGTYKPLFPTTKWLQRHLQLLETDTMQRHRGSPWAVHVCRVPVHRSFNLAVMLRTLHQESSKDGQLIFRPATKRNQTGLGFCAALLPAIHFI